MSTTENISRKENMIEKYSENAGGFCEKCSNRTLGQCLSCYNCNICDGKCVNGNVIDAQNENKKTCSLVLPNDIYWRNLNVNYL